MKKRAFITGITGQDGSYLAELLLREGYEVHGLIRRVAAEDQMQRQSRIAHLLDKVILHHGDITDARRMHQILTSIVPDEVYHLAAQSHVAVSFEDVSGTMKSIIDGTIILLEILSSTLPGCRMYNAATSEMFGKVFESPQNEFTPLNPISPYGIAKAAAFRMTRLFRERGLFVSSGILFNHESPRRGMDFVTRKITRAIAQMKYAGTPGSNVLVLGNLAAERDWGFAPDYVYAMWLMLQHYTSDDFVVATGEQRSVLEFIDAVLDCAGLNGSVVFLDYSRETEANADRLVSEISQVNQLYIVQHPRFFRPAEVDVLCGDYSKILNILGWKPIVSFSNLVQSMVEQDCEDVLHSR